MPVGERAPRPRRLFHRPVVFEIAPQPEVLLLALRDADLAVERDDVPVPEGVAVEPGAARPGAVAEIVEIRQRPGRLVFVVAGARIGAALDGVPTAARSNSGNRPPCALKYALSPVVKTVPAILSSSFAVASALAPRSAAPQSAMSPAPTRTAIWGVGGGGGGSMMIGSGPGPGALARPPPHAPASRRRISAPDDERARSPSNLFIGRNAALSFNHRAAATVPKCAARSIAATVRCIGCYSPAPDQ